MKIQTTRTRATRGAFSLLEVMFALVAFCTATFVILALVSNSLKNARRLQRPMVDAGVLAAELSQTNQLIEGVLRGNLADSLGNAYQSYSWAYEIREAQTNRLFQVDFLVQQASSDRPVISKMSILLFRPNSPAGSLDGATIRR
jgi:hypothetical protein